MARKPLKAKAEYQRERRRARERIKYAEKKGYKTAELPPPVKRNATAKDYKKAAREARKAQREQAKYTKEKAPREEFREDFAELDEYYTLFCETFLDLVNRIPEYIAPETKGKYTIIGWFESLRMREGDKAAAQTIAAASKAGMILENALFYEPRVQAWITEATQHLGIDIPITEMEQMTYQE